MHFVACKTVREYNRNREKIRKFCLEEKRQLQMRETEQATPVDEATMDPVGTSKFQAQQQAGPSGKKPKPHHPETPHQTYTESAIALEKDTSSTEKQNVDI